MTKDPPLASIRRQGSRYEIRESLDTPRGPRQRVLVRFDAILTPEVLDEAAARARRPFDRAALLARARERGVPVAEGYRSDEARELLAALRGGRPLQPAVVGLLREALAGCEAAPLPEHLEDAAEWLGASEAARGKALRGLLRTASRAARSPDALPLADAPDFPGLGAARDR